MATQKELDKTYMDMAIAMSKLSKGVRAKVGGGIPTGRLTTISSLSFDSDKLENYLVESIKEGWRSNLKELKIQYIRDKNLRDLLGED